ncbi:hypothetical protein H5410_024700 [Solanum commersonii]|uniref:Uncharacterized protein n=1 Tax=Solanum commersonii TaxID=4109 RepID=A0A9J5ZMQ4_SOLCO|nr:hypothetical protein H5410_024700 [Solanum commersonii]
MLSAQNTPVEVLGVGLKGYEQKLEYEGVPAFCRTCHLQGHDQRKLKTKGKRGRTRFDNTQGNKDNKGKDAQNQSETSTKQGNSIQNNDAQRDDGFIQVQGKETKNKRTILQSTSQTMRRKIIPRSTTLKLKWKETKIQSKKTPRYKGNILGNLKQASHKTILKKINQVEKQKKTEKGKKKNQNGLAGALMKVKSTVCVKVKQINKLREEKLELSKIRKETKKDNAIAQVH